MKENPYLQLLLAQAASLQRRDGATVLVLGSARVESQQRHLGFAIDQLLRPTPQPDFGQGPLVGSEDAHTPAPAVDLSRPASSQALALQHIGQQPDVSLFRAAHPDDAQAQRGQLLSAGVVGPVLAGPT